MSDNVDDDDPITAAARMGANARRGGRPVANGDDELAYQQTASVIPIPDPSLITSREIMRAKNELRAEFTYALGSMRELLTMSAASNKEIIETRLSGMDRTHVLLQEEVKRTVIECRDNNKQLEQILDSKIHDLEVLFSEKLTGITTRFDGITIQFQERDIRAANSEQAMKEAAAAQALSGTTAVNAALQAQKESAFATQQANKEAISKSEGGFQERIKALESLITATKDSLVSSINELGSRLDRGEGGDQGIRMAVKDRQESTANSAIVIGGVVGFLVLVVMIVGTWVTLHTSTPSYTETATITSTAKIETLLQALQANDAAQTQRLQMLEQRLTGTGTGTGTGIGR